MLSTSSVIQHVDSVSSGLITPVHFVRRNHVTKGLLGRLGLEASLQGHRGCVNCLEWNHRGTLLASGSDDFCIIIWNPFDRKNVFTMRTGHAGNIFSVKFLPNINEYLMVTGAADAKVRVHDVCRTETRHVFSCHSGRVKRLATVPAEPYLFWSASEDGTVRQFDLRDPSQASCAASNNVLVDLHLHIGPSAEAKCLALNPVRPEMVAVGGNDQFVRVYDRRKLCLCASSSSTHSQFALSPSNFNDDSQADMPTHELSPESVRYLAPGNLSLKQLFYHRGANNIVNVTCVSFSPDGEELLANMSGGQLYLFTLNKHLQPYWCTESLANSKSNQGLIFGASHSDRVLSAGSASLLRHPIPTTAGRCRICRRSKSNLNPSILEEESLNATQLIKTKAFVAAVMLYNELLERWPNNPQLYTGRATALLKRNWIGDVYNALLDCQTTLRLTKANYPTDAVDSAITVKFTLPSLARDCIRVTAFLLSVQCMLRLHWIREARATLDRVQSGYPYLVTTSSSNDPQSCVTYALPPLMDMLNNGYQQNGFNLLRTLETLNEVLDVKQPSFHAFFDSLSLQVRRVEVHSDEVESIKVPSATAVKGIIPTEDDTETVTSTSDFLASPSNGRSDRDANVVPEHPSFDELLASLENTILPSMDPADHWDEVPTEFRQCSCFGCVTSMSCSSTSEVRLRSHTSDYTRRYIGHCNVITDIKEANFFGSYGEFIVGGSDCGSFFVWNRQTTNIVRILDADSSTVNCVQPHPSICLLATSGIDSVVRIWAPRPESDTDQSRVVKDHIRVAERNQLRSTADPMEMMVLHMGGIPQLAFTLDRRSRSRRRNSQSVVGSSQAEYDRTRSSSPSHSEGELDSRNSREHSDDVDDYMFSDEFNAMIEMVETSIFSAINRERSNPMQGSGASDTENTVEQPSRTLSIPRRRERGRASHSTGSRSLPKRFRGEPNDTPQTVVTYVGFDGRHNGDDEDEDEDNSGPAESDRRNDAQVVMPRIHVTLQTTTHLADEVSPAGDMAEDIRHDPAEVEGIGNSASEEANNTGFESPRTS